MSQVKSAKERDVAMKKFLLRRDNPFVDEMLPSAPSSFLVEPLTEREVEVLRYVAIGLSNREIGQQLSIAQGTVKQHLSNVYRKLGVRNRVQAVVWANQLSLF